MTHWHGSVEMDRQIRLCIRINVRWLTIPQEIKTMRAIILVMLSLQSTHYVAAAAQNSTTWDLAYLRSISSASIPGLGISNERMSEIPEWPPVNWPASATQSLRLGVVKSTGYFISHSIRDTTVTVDTVLQSVDLCSRILGGGQLGNVAIALECHYLIDDAADIVFYSENSATETKAIILKAVDELIRRDRQVVAQYLLNKGRIDVKTASKITTATGTDAWSPLGAVCLDATPEFKDWGKAQKLLDSVPSPYYGQTVEYLILQILSRQSHQEIRRCIFEVEMHGLVPHSDDSNDTVRSLQAAGISKEDVPASYIMEVNGEHDFWIVLSERINAGPPPAVQLKREGRY